MQKEKVVGYQSFMLRCWQEQSAAAPQQRPGWRFMLQDVSAPQDLHVFATFEQMVAFLRQNIIEEVKEAEGG